MDGCFVGEPLGCRDGFNEMLGCNDVCSVGCVEVLGLYDGCLDMFGEADDGAVVGGGVGVGPALGSGVTLDVGGFVPDVLSVQEKIS